MLNKYFIALVVVAFLMPLASDVSLAQINLGKSTHVNVSVNGKRTYIVKNNRTSLEVEMKGDIELNEDESEVIAISRGGYLEIKEKKQGVRHHVLIEGESGGRMSFSYKRNGKRLDYEDMDKRWFSEVLLQIIRETGVDAERRVGRLLARGGTDLVLDEVELIDSSGSRTRYLIHLFDQADLNNAALERASRLGRDIPSSGDKTRFLIASSDAFLAAKDMESDYFAAVESIPSSGDKTRVLMHLVKEEMLDRHPAYLGAVRVAATIPSSGDRSRFLMSAADVYLEDSHDDYFRAVNGIPSSGDKTRVLLSLVENDVLEEHDAYLAALESAKTIPSSGDRARFLMAVAPIYMEEARGAYFAAVNDLPSSGDHARVLLKLLDSASLDDASITSVLRSASKMASSGDKTRVLLAVSDLVAGHDELVEVYLETVDTIPSSGDQKRALAALLN